MVYHTVLPTGIVEARQDEGSAFADECPVASLRFVPLEAPVRVVDLVFAALGMMQGVRDEGNY